MKRSFLLILLVCFNANAQQHRIEEDFRLWTNGFNHKNLTVSCDFFSKDLVANYRGFPEKNYKIVCDGFKKIFAEDNTRYQYHYKLHQIYNNDSLAAVRVTWYLKVYRNNKLITNTQDEGLDVLKKEGDGKWRIVNYLGYEK